MKKITTIILSILACTACSVSGAAILHAQKTVRANASEPVPATHLLLPDSYEEYLHLTAPTDVAVTENYTAIADGNVIYVYDRADGVYREYVHDLNVDPLKNNVTKLQFDEAGDLYFLDATYLYVLETDTLDEADPTVRNTKFPCSTFYLHGNMLYYTDTKPSNTQLYALDLAAYDIDGTYARTLTTGELSGKPTITVYNGELYYTSGNNVRRLNLETEKYSTVAVFDNFPAIFSIRIVNGVFCCTSANNPKNFYAYDLADLMDVFAADDSNITPLHKTAGAFSALTAFGNAVYAVDGNSIREYDAVENEFTNYEISNRSSSKHRIDGGTETYLAGNLLLIADSGNQRISVLDTLTGEFGEPIANTLSTSYLVSDGKSVLVANERNAVLYSLEASSYGAKLKEFDDFNGKIIGAASVYGKYYLASNNYCHYVIGQDEQTGWMLTEVQRQPKQMATLLTADAYGYLYLVSGGKIYLYTEAEFLSEDSDGNQLEGYDELPALTKKISVDYDGNIYALIDGGLHKLGNQEAYPLNQPLVYTDEATVVSFAFGIENNATYVLYQENYMAKTELLQLPTVKNIAVDGADERIFAGESAEFSVVQTLQGALVIYFDIHTLQDAEVFPYQAYERASAPFTALKIGETATQNVIAVFNAETHEYQTCLVLKTQCEELPPDEYRENYPTEKIGYLTNAVSLYKFPYLTSLLTVSRLSQGSQILLLGEIDKLDHPYYHVAFVDENGVRQTGFVPKTYVTSFNGAPPVPETVVYGGTGNNNESIFRLCYLILGAGAISILFDVLLLKKRKDDDENN